MDRAYVINLDEYADVGTQWIALYIKNIEIGFIDFMFAGKTFIDYTSLFLPYDFGENDDIIVDYLKNE